MKLNSFIKVFMALIFLALAVNAVYLYFHAGKTALAQPLPEGQLPPGPGPGFPPGPGMPGMGPMPPMMLGGASLCAAGDFVYVLRGNTLYQFLARELKLVNQVQLPEPPRMMTPERPREVPRARERERERETPER